MENPQVAVDRRRVLARRVRLLLGFFVVGMVLSGLTAFPLERELDLVTRWIGVPEAAGPGAYAGLTGWLVTVRTGLRATYAAYPWMAYGTDWLAFAHLVLALLFLGALRDPVRNLWVLEFGLLACVLVLPMAFLCGALRGIPWGWRLIDCSFGVGGFVPLWLARSYTLELAARRD